MRAVTWLSLLSAGTVLVACGGYSNLGNGPEGGGGDDDGSGGSSMQSGGQAGQGSGKGGNSMGSSGTQSTGTGGTGMGTAGTQSTGTGGGNSTGGTTGTSCARLPCGSSCTIFPLPTPMTDAAAGADAAADIAAAVGYCAPDGSCGLAFPMCPSTACETNMDCPSLPATCDRCADGMLSCPANVCVDGVCVVDAPGCGDECATSMDCAVAAAPCQQCPDGTSSCPTVECVMGRCVGGVPGCSDREPCEGLTCGDRCNPCSPDDVDCPVSQVLSFCNTEGMCQTGTPNCGSGSVCMAAQDCRQTELCYMCADGTCGEVDCLNGRCGFSCPDVPLCMTADDCGTPPPNCEPCADGTCEQMACVNGACQMICGAGT